MPQNPGFRQCALYSVFKVRNIGLGISVPILSFVALGGMATLSFALIYRLLPRARVAWRHIWVGATVAGVLATIATTLVGIYLGAARLASASGAAGTVVVLLVGFNLLGQFFVLGAVFTRVHAALQGSPIVPKEQGDRSTEAQ